VRTSYIFFAMALRGFRKTVLWNHK